MKLGDKTNKDGRKGYKFLYSFALLLFLNLFFCESAMAQFNPSNPPEPNKTYKYKITTACNPAENVAWTSGDGSYEQGTVVMISTSSYNSNYKFRYWTMNGDSCSASREFYYTVGNAPAHFVAHYRYEPQNPQEPDLIYKRILTLQSSPQGKSTFSQDSGNRFEINSQIWLDCYPNYGYVFRGWYEGETLISDSKGFTYTMPDRNVTLTAKIEYSPENPGDPEGGQTDVVTKVVGDMNGDNVVTMEDVNYVVQQYLSKTTDASIIEKCDLNGDGIIDVSDAVYILNIIMKRNN